MTVLCAKGYFSSAQTGIVSLSHDRNLQEFFLGFFKGCIFFLPIQNGAQLLVGLSHSFKRKSSRDINVFTIQCIL